MSYWAHITGKVEFHAIPEDITLTLAGREYAVIDFSKIPKLGASLTDAEVYLMTNEVVSQSKISKAYQEIAQKQYDKIRATQLDLPRGSEGALQYDIIVKRDSVIVNYYGSLRDIYIVRAEMTPNQDFNEIFPYFERLAREYPGEVSITLNINQFMFCYDKDECVWYHNGNPLT